MNQVKTISGRGIPVRGNDIDTDRIIPARFLRCVTFDGLGSSAFIDDRSQANGQHPFDLPQYQGANILVVNNNFGCGSSREHAPQALSKWGIQAIVGESFAEIFFGNCLAMGVPCLTLEPEKVKQLQQKLLDEPRAATTVDLEAMAVSCGDWQASVSLNEGARKMLLGGTWDTVGQLCENVDLIKLTAANLPYINWKTPAGAS